MRKSVLSLVSLFAVSAFACGGAPDAPAPLQASDGGIAPSPTASGSGSTELPDGGQVLPGRDPRPDADAGPTAVPPPPPTKPNEITEQFGVFVSPSGQSNASGTRTAPLASIEAAIERAKNENKKKVFVCEGSYAETLTLADGVSIEGRLDCSAPDWKLDETKHVDLAAPSSPAIRATNITSATRIDGFRVASPDATTPSGSSIAVLAVDSNGLTFANGMITAGNGMKGDDGVEGEQLRQESTASEARGASEAIAACFWFGVRCTNANKWSRPGASGSSARCLGVDGREVSRSRGGTGASTGAYYRVSFHDAWVMVIAPVPQEPGSGTGADGGNGANGLEGSLSEQGYRPGDGTRGSSGEVGRGGDGAAVVGPNGFALGADYWWGRLGGGGGAGGCQGLAGTPGKGGGASIGVLALRSPIQIVDAVVTSASGGQGGAGTLGSDPTPGLSTGETQGVAGNAMNGSRGGVPGVSGHGAGGPSFAVAHSGASPILTGTRASVGAGGEAAAEQRKVVLGVERVLPAGTKGEALDLKSF